jgi:hypothetical protein
MTSPAPVAPVVATAKTIAAPVTVAAQPKAEHRSHRLAVRPAAQTAGGPQLVQGMVVGLDPETGQFGIPSKDQLDALGAVENPLNWSSEGLEVVTLSGGGKMIDVQGRFQDYTVVRTGADGKLHYDCVQGAGEATRLMNVPVTDVDPKSGLEVR